jgi:hypothetical protein
MYYRAPPHTYLCCNADLLTVLCSSQNTHHVAGTTCTITVLPAHHRTHVRHLSSCQMHNATHSFLHVTGIVYIYYIHHTTTLNDNTLQHLQQTTNSTNTYSSLHANMLQMFTVATSCDHICVSTTSVILLHRDDHAYDHAIDRTCFHPCPCLPFLACLSAASSFSSARSCPADAPLCFATTTLASNPSHTRSERHKNVHTFHILRFGPLRSHPGPS